MTMDREQELLDIIQGLQDVVKKALDRLETVEGKVAILDGGKDKNQALDAEYISQIASLYPADSEYNASADIGKKLLEQAKMEVLGWRNEPTAVLLRYMELCIATERRGY